MFLLASGWAIALAALLRLTAGPAQGAFALAGAGVQALGLALLFKAHMPAPGDRR